MAKTPDSDVWLAPTYQMSDPGTCPYCGMKGIKTAGGFRDHLHMLHFAGMAQIVQGQMRDLRLGKAAHRFVKQL